MRNRPHHDWSSTGTYAQQARGLNAAPARRLLILFLFCVAPLVAISLRMAQLQLNLQSGYVAPFAHLREVVEVIPAREGRILAADGSILADDLPRYDILLHYRWLEQPLDRQWLRRKAWEQLSRAERRQPGAVAAKELQISAERDRLWAELCELSGHSLADLTDTSRQIQIRVERIWDSVNARRNAQANPEATPLATPSSPTALPPVAIWASWWRRLAEELTTHPERISHEPLVVREQEDYHVVWSNVPAELANTIAAHPERFPGVKSRRHSRRVYPHGDLAAHILGARTPLREDEAPSDDAASQPGTPRGRTGLERHYEEHLHGRPGKLQQFVNRHGEVVETRVLNAARDGRDLVLTLDLSLQQRAEQLLDRALLTPVQAGEDATPRTTPQELAPPGGCLVAIDVHTGAVLAAAVAPRFDANLLVSPDAAAWAELASDPRKPFYPRLTHMALPPGSVFKAVTAAALLQSGVLQAHETIPCVGYLDRPEQHRCLIFRHYGVGHGDTDLSQALCQSCNVYFFAGARRAGPAPLVDWARRFGIGSPTGIDLPNETAGSLPSPDRAAATAARRWFAGDTLGLAIGQSSLTTTPLQIARMMAAIANDGLLVTPHLATSSGPTTLEMAPGESVRPVFAHPEPFPIPDLDSATLATIREGLFRVVNDPQGTGCKTVRLKEVSIAGKTGTAEVGGGRPDHAWFAGYAPAEQPRVAFAVVIEHGGSGSKTAGPIAREFVRGLLELGLISPNSSLADAQARNRQ